MRLITKIILIGFAVCGLVVVVLTRLTYTTTYQLLENSAQEKYELLTAQTLEKIDQYIFLQLTNIRLYAKQLYVQDAINEIAKQDIGKEELQRIVKQDGNWDALKIVDRNGVIIVSTSDEVYTHIEEIPYEINAYKNALSGTEYVSDILVKRDRDSVNQTIVIAIPIRDISTNNSEVMGVLLGRLNWPVIQEIITNTEVPLMRLYDKNNRQLITVEDKVVNNYIANDTSVLINKSINGFNNKGIYTTVAPGTNGVENALFVRAKELGFEEYKGNNWILEIEIPSATVFAKAIAISNTMVIAIILIASVALVLIVLTFKVLCLTPVNTLNTQLSDIINSNNKRDIIIATHDEIHDSAVLVNTLMKKHSEKDIAADNTIHQLNQQIELFTRQVDTLERQVGYFKHLQDK